MSQHQPGFLFWKKDRNTMCESTFVYSFSNQNVMKLFTSAILFPLTLAVIISSCKKDPEPQPDPQPQPTGCPATVTDIDGNIYPVVKIGNQCWMATNLRTTKYRNGQGINTLLNETNWTYAAEGAYAIYDNDPANEAIYGKLYNGYAVKTGLLCPNGWRIPTDDEFKTMETHLGMTEADLNLTGERGYDEAVGGKLKGLTLWDEPNAGATNSSGFNALPSGQRNSQGEYISIQQYTDFWTSTGYPGTDDFQYLRTLYYNGQGIGRHFVNINKGTACRCIKE
jgi:uncharacterized protein (TIGR02145 family)